MSRPEPNRKPTAPGRVRLEWPGGEAGGRPDPPAPRRPEPAAAAEDVEPAGPAGAAAEELAALRRAVEELRAGIVGLQDEVAALRAEVTGLRRRLPLRAADPE